MIEKLLHELTPETPLPGADADGKYRFVYTENGEDEPEALRQLAIAMFSVGNLILLSKVLDRLVYLAEAK